MFAVQRFAGIVPAAPSARQGTPASPWRRRYIPPAVPTSRLGCGEKVDGGRALAYKDPNRVRLLSRQRKDWMRRFNGLVAIVGALEAHTRKSGWDFRGSADRPAAAVIAGS